MPAFEGGADLSRDLLVGFAEEMTSLRVSDQRRPRTRLHDQRQRQLAGEGALRLPVHVLGTDGDVRPAGGRLAGGADATPRAERTRVAVPRTGAVTCEETREERRARPTGRDASSSWRRR